MPVKKKVVKNAVGRPTKYSQAMLNEANDYLLNYEENGDVIPSIVGLALALNLHRDTINDWSRQESKAEFSAILEKINQTQQNVLIKKGLKGEFNSNITKLVLGKHGFHDKQDITGEDGKPFIPPVIRIINE